MEIKISKMCDWERQKAIFLMGEAEKLGINTNSYGEVAVNNSSGYVYIWSEDHNFSLYMPISCELQKSDIVALWTSSEDGEEREFNLTNNTTLEKLENWAEEQEKSLEVEK